MPDILLRRDLHENDRQVVVAVVQQRLKEKGQQLEADGIFGSETETAVKNFQDATGIEVDGIVGPITLNRLGFDQELLSHALESWPRLASFRPNAAIQTEITDRGLGWHFHRIEDGWGPVNLDFHPVQVSKLPTVNGTELTAAQLLTLFRTTINNFVDTDVSEFSPYDDEDKVKWEGNHPLTAVIHINMGDPFGIVNITDGSVATTEFAHSAWTFSTIWTLGDQDHPVSGNREFGFIERADDVIFYVRAADRITEVEDAILEQIGGIVFDGAKKLWVSFQQGLASFVNSHGGEAQVLESNTISQRFNWVDFQEEVFNPTSEWIPSMPSSILDWIRTKIETRLGTSPTLQIDQGVLGSAENAELMQRLMGSPSLTLENASLVADNDRLSVRGLAPLLDSNPIPTDVTFLDDDGLVVNVEGRVPAQTPVATDVIGRFVGGAVSIPNGLTSLRIKTVSVSMIASQNKAVLEIADTGDTTFAGFLTVRQPKLAISVSALEQANPTVAAHFSGLLVISSVPFRVEAKVGDDSAFSVVPASDVLLSSEQLISELLDGVVPNLPDLPITDLVILADFDTGDLTLSASAMGAWSIPLGNNAPEMTEITFSIEKDGDNVSGRIAARLSVAGEEVEVHGAIPGEFSVSGSLPVVGLLDFVDRITGPVLAIPPGIPSFQLDDSRFVVVFNGATPRLVLHTAIDGFGSVVVIVTEVGGDWEALLAAVPADGWKFSDLAPVFAPLDIFNVKAPRVWIASFASQDFVVPSIGGIELAGRIHEGISLDATLSLEGGGLDFVSALIGLDELPLRLSAVNDLATAEITAALEGTRVLVPSVLTLENVEVALTPNPLAVFLRSEARVVIEGNELPRFRVAAGISEGTQKFTLETAEPWSNPFGISGLTIRQAILDVQTAPTPAYGILGDVAVAGNIIRVAAQFVGNAPSAIVGELQGRLALSDVVEDLVGLSIPPVLDLSIEDFSLQVVSNPLGVTIGSVFFEPGLSLRGTIGMLGLEMLVNVRIRPDDGVFASGSLKSKVEIGRVLSISNASGNGPPSMLLDTTGSPMLQLSGKLVVLGISETIEASIERSGFSLRLERDLVIGRYALDTTFESTDRFRVSGTFEFGLSASIETDLGKIVLDTGCSGSLRVKMENGAFELVADGGFTFVGNTLSIPTLRITAEIDSLDEIPPRIRDSVVDKVEEVFQGILEDPAKWVQAIAANAIREVEDVAKQLKERFGKDAEFIGRQLKTVLLKSSVEVGQALKGIGEAPERIATVLRDLGDPAANVRETLDRIGVPAAEIGRIMRDAFPDIPHLDETIHTDTHADSPVIPPVRQHTDTPLVPHVDQHTDSPVIPHVDQHTDSPVIPPVRQHADTPLIPGVSLHTDGRGPRVVNAHTDFGGGIAHGDAHGDVPGPHLDTHTDTPAVGHVDAHNDTPGRGHLDAHNDESGRGHLDAHNDEAGRGHLDAHNDEPGRGHLDAHGDTAAHVDAP